MNLSYISPDRRIAKSRAQLLMTEPFFGCVAVHLEPRESPDTKTTSTNGDALFYNPDYIATLDNEELKGAIAQVVMHIAMQHHTRRGFRDAARWNRAGDLAINPELIERGFKLPGQPEIDPDLAGLSIEAIYARLEQQDQQNQQPQGGGNNSGNAQPQPGCGEVLDAAPSHDQAAMKAAEAKTQSVVRQARMMARKKEGGLPEDLERLIENMVEPKVDWREILRTFIDDRRQTDFAWTRPNRRFVPQGIYLPGQIPDGISHVVLAVDTSGSINNHALETFAAEIRSALEDGSIDELTVVYADSQVKGHEKFSPDDEFSLTPVGGGGTAFEQTFEWIEEHAPDAVAVIYFTDLECSRFGQEPACPVLWATWDYERRFDELANRTPFGEAIFIKNVY